MGEEIRMEDREPKGIVWQDRKHWMWFPFSFTKYRIENGRLFVEEGLLRTEENECLLYRITDISLERTLAQKLFGTGTICLTTRDISDKVIYLKNIVNSKAVKQQISEMVEAARINSRVVGREMYGMGRDASLHMEDGGIEYEDIHPGPPPDEL
ncbi:PH domain-containing protein [Hominifimenecus sp. rT4P-3]|uniref:PH domain-containing protein n=1 Tax=Hominifimenecus sp. rT4P-3 TaxID=3242979 RepID=UPI003DA1CE52